MHDARVKDMMRMVDIPSSWLIIVGFSSFQSFRMKLIDLIMALNSEGEVYWRPWAIVPYAISGIANKRIWRSLRWVLRGARAAS